MSMLPPKPAGVPFAASRMIDALMGPPAPRFVGTPTLTPDMLTQLKSWHLAALNDASNQPDNVYKHQAQTLEQVLRLMHGLPLDVSAAPTELTGPATLTPVMVATLKTWHLAALDNADKETLYPAFVAYETQAETLEEVLALLYGVQLEDED